MRTPSAPDLHRLFSPRSIAVIGASESVKSIGGMPMHYLTTMGYSGKVYPVNPKRETLFDLPCYPSVDALPEVVDVALIAVGAALVPTIIRQCGERGVPFAVVMASGFGEAGEAGQKLEAELRAAVAETGIRLVGPNCLGLLNVADNVRCGFGQGLGERNYKLGPVGLVTQSGGYGFTLVKNAHREGMGFRYVASIGNSYDLNVLDFIEYYLESPDIQIVAAFIEGVADGRRLIALGKRALELNKPILVWKAGTTASGAHAAASHTASMAASYALYQAAFREGGYIEVRDYEDFVDITRAFVGGIEPGGDRVCIVSGSGGAGVVASDRFEEAGLSLPQLSPGTVAAMEKVIPQFGVIANPIDISANRTSDGRSASNVAVDVVLSSNDFDMAMVRSQQTTGSAAVAEQLVEIRNRTGKQIFAAMNADDSAEAKAVFDAHKLPWHLTVARAAIAARALADFHARRRAAGSGATAQRPLEKVEIDLAGDNGAFVSEYASRRALASYGIPSDTARFIAESDLDSTDLGGLVFPVAVKGHAAEIPHKSEANAIQLGLKNPDEARQAAREVIAAARAYAPDANVDGVLMQPMVGGTEVILGAVVDDCFGPVVLFGLGGIFAEIMQDVTYAFAPFGPDKAREMLRGIKGFPLLDGYRGRAPADLDALADMVSRLSWLIADHADHIDSIDINPVFVDGASLSIADALIVRKSHS